MNKLKFSNFFVIKIYKKKKKFDNITYANGNINISDIFKYTSLENLCY